MVVSEIRHTAVLSNFQMEKSETKAQEVDGEMKISLQKLFGLKGDLLWSSVD